MLEESQISLVSSGGSGPHEESTGPISKLLERTRQFSMPETIKTENIMLSHPSCNCQKNDTVHAATTSSKPKDGQFIQTRLAGMPRGGVLSV